MMQQWVRGPGEGAVSDYERRLFAQAVPGLGMSDAGAANVIPGWRAALRRTQERVSFFEEWRRRHGSLDGATGAWARFAQENPIVTERQGGGLQVNEGNVANWQPYLDPNYSRPSGTTTTPQTTQQQTPAAGTQTPPPAGGQGQIPPRPSSVPDGSQYNPARQQWRDGQGRLYDARGQRLGTR
jgi:hypothetical protein